MPAPATKDEVAILRMQVSRLEREVMDHAHSLQLIITKLEPIAQALKNKPSMYDDLREKKLCLPKPE